MSQELSHLLINEDEYIITDAGSVTGVTYNAVQKKLEQTIDGNISDIVTIAKIKEDLALVKADVGLGNADNTADVDKPISTATQTALNGKKNVQTAVADPTASGTGVQFISSASQDEQGVIMLTKKTVRTFGAASAGGNGTTGLVPAPQSGEQEYYLGGDSDWHEFTKSTVGLGNVDNTSDANKPISTATQAALDNKLETSLKGANNGLAELDANGKVPAAQLPSYVDDVLEYATQSAFPATGESGKIYVDLSTNKSYRWGGSAYVNIASDLALGETESTAYRGDRGKIAYDHASAKGNQYASGLYKITTNAEGHVTGAVAVEKADITTLGIPGQDTTYNEATQSTSGLMSANDKTKLDGVETGATANIGTITKVQANGTDVASSGVANIPAATLSAYGVTKLSSAIDSTSEDVAATPKAVKLAYDLADGKVSCTTQNVKTALGTTSGTVKYLREDGTWDTPPGAVYDNYPAAQGGTDKSLVLTGDKYNWDQKISCTQQNIVTALGFTPVEPGHFTWGDLYTATAPEPEEEEET